MDAIVLKTKDGLNGKGGVVGTLALMKCNVCGTEKWIPGSKIKDGYGKFCSKECTHKHQRTKTGKLSHRWKGGRCKMSGYWHIKIGYKNYRREHVLKMEEKIGRRIYAHECVHHINGIKTDNRIENLQLMSRSDHSRLHCEKMDLHKHLRKYLIRKYISRFL